MLETTGILLSAPEVGNLTGKERPSAQIRALRQMGIQHMRRPDGSVAVLRCHVVQLLGGVGALQSRRKTEPDFSEVS